MLLDGLEDMIKKAGDGEGADAADLGGDGGEVGAAADNVGDIAFQDSVFAGSASIDDNGARFDEIIRNQTGNASRSYNYIKLLKFCQVIATMKEFGIVI